jgi:hypothetical protein
MCTTCNTQWMRRLADAAKSLLVQMFNVEGSHVELDEAGQTILTRWAFKTAAVGVVYADSSRSRDPFPPSTASGFT